MDPQELIVLAEKLAAGSLTSEEIGRWLDRIRSESSSAGSARLSTATVDLDRRRRCGFPEVVFGQGKSVAMLREIFAALVARGENVLATRIGPDTAAELLAEFPEARYNEVARTFRVQGSGFRNHGTEPRPRSPDSSQSAIRNPNSEIPFVAIITAGSSDLPVAEEARETLDWMGVRVAMIHDVGVAGPHRLPARLAEFQDADAIVVVAGMEGALPSIVGGYVPCPVFGVPTSVGYGANFGGISALLSMLNSCASNVAVVNIDAGFKAAYLAGLIATRRHQGQTADARE
jgi:pyridinium-3,5-biscarboxylic acid mononucleotide synthase